MFEPTAYVKGGHSSFNTKVSNADLAHIRSNLGTSFKHSFDILVLNAMGEIKKWSEDRMNCAEALRLIHTMCKSGSELCKSLIVLETFTTIADETLAEKT